MAAEQSVDGQFDDAPEIGVPTLDPRAGGTFIDDPLLEWSEPEDGDEEYEDDELKEEDYNDNRAEDEDWEIAERGTLLANQSYFQLKTRRLHEAV